MKSDLGERENEILCPLLIRFHFFVPCALGQLQVEWSEKTNQTNDLSRKK